MILKHKILLLCFLFFPASVAFAWEKSVDKNNIQVFTRPVENSPLKEFQAKTEIKATPKQILSILQDGDTMKQWWPDCLESKVLNRSGSKEWTVYFVTKVPFPLNNRDTINKFEILEESPIKINIRITGIPNYNPEKDGLVRLPELKGSWTLISVGEITEVTYQLHANPGGNIPAFLANSTVTDSPYKALISLKEKSEKAK